MAIALLVPVRMSDTPESMGLLVVIATLLVAAGCAMHLAALIGVMPVSRALRGVLVVGAWGAMFAGAAWAMSRAPGSELVVAMMTVPPLIGLAGCVWPPEGRPVHGVPFLVLATALALLVLPAWLERLNG